MVVQMLRIAAAALAIGYVTTAAPTRAGPIVPTTAEEHEHLAKEYEAKAREWRQISTSHREQVAAYDKVPDAGLQTGLARVHCEAIAEDAARLAAHADELASYHRAKAVELKRK